MQVRVHAFQIRQGDTLTQDHPIQAAHEVHTQGPAVEDSKAGTAPDELEVVEMLRVNSRCRVNSEGGVVVHGVFEQRVGGVEYFAV